MWFWGNIMAFLDKAFSKKHQIYTKKQLDLIRRSKLQKVQSFEATYLRILEKSNRCLKQEVERSIIEGPDRLESWRLEFELEIRDDALIDVFQIMDKAVDLILSLNAEDD